MADTIFERLKNVIVKQLGVEEEEVVPEAVFSNKVSDDRPNLDADSLDLVELIMAFEEEFHMEISDEDAEKIITVQNAIDYIEAHASAQTA